MRKTNLLISLCIFLSFMVGATSIMAKNATSQSHQSSKTVQVANTVVNINIATIAELETLKRIGAKKAAAIVAYRKAHGAFKSLEDLTQVKGVSEGIVAANKDRLKLT